MTVAIRRRLQSTVGVPQSRTNEARTISHCTHESPARYTEEEIVRLAQQGHPNAFECLYRMHSSHIYFLCCRITGSMKLAEDVTRDSFLQVFRNIHAGRIQLPLLPSLHRTATKLALMKRRLAKSD